MRIYSGLSEMTHLSENSRRLRVHHISVRGQETIQKELTSFNDVCLLILPLNPQGQRSNSVEIVNC